MFFFLSYQHANLKSYMVAAAAAAAAEQALFCKLTLEWTKYKSDHYFSLENEPSEVVSTFQVLNQIKA